MPFNFSIISLILTLGIIGALIIESKINHQAYQQHPPPGKKIDIGGRSLHAIISGQGKPVVVFEHALPSAFSLTWDSVQKQVESFATTCSYDRAGYGWSDNSPLPRTSEHIAEDLNKLLQTANLQPPYILVGYCVGAHHIRVFANKYPEKVAGIILVDPAHEDEDFSMPKSLLFSRFAATIGLGRLFPLFSVTASSDAYSFNLRPLIDFGWKQTRFLSTVYKELKALPICKKQVTACGSLGSIPLTIISAGKYNIDQTPREIEQHKNYQKSLLKLSSQSTQLIAKNSGHRIPIEQPEIIVKAIQDMINLPKQIIRSSNDKLKKHLN